MKKIFPFYLFSFLILISLSPISAQPLTFESKGIGGGGALFSPSINPNFSNELFVACDMSELFHTTTGGTKWEIIPFTKIQGGHNSKMQFTKFSDLRYCIDYTSKDGNDYARPVKSTDQGVTWKTFSANPYPNDICYHFSTDYNNPDRLIFGFYNEIYFSNDGGTSINKIYTCKSNNEGNHVAGVFFKNDSIYIGLNDGILFSNDGGKNFSLMNTTGIPSGEKLLSFSAGIKNGKIRFIGLTLNNVWAGIQHAFEYSAGNVSSMQGVYIMDNADGNWNQKISGINKSTDYPVFTGMAENNIDIMYLSGGSSTGDPIVMKTTDGGNSWKHVLNTSFNKNISTGWCGYQGDRNWSYAECPFGFTVSAVNANHIVFTDFGFSHQSINGGQSWFQQYVDPINQNTINTATPKQKFYKSIGLENTTNWHICWLDSFRLFSCYSDINGITSDDKGNSWKFIPNLTQNSVYHLIKSTEGTLYAATSDVHDLYQSTRLTDNIIDAGKGGIYHSKDGGSSFSLLQDFKHPVVWIALDPKNSKRMLASVVSSTEGGIYESTNIDLGAGSTWTKLASPARTQGHPFNIRFLRNGHLLVSYSGRRAGTPQQFTASSGVFYSTDGGKTWVDKSITAMKYWTKDIVIDPNDETESTWYVSVFSGWGNIPSETGGLYRSIDRGENWVKISSILSSYRVNSCTVNPENKNEIYYTTETDGLWYSNNATSSIPTFKRVDSYPFRHPVRVFFNPFKNSEIWVSGFGSGMMKGDFSNSSKLEKSPSISTFKLYPNPSNNYIQIEAIEIVEIKIYDFAGKCVMHSISNNSSNHEIIDISSFNSGLYFLKLHTPTGDYTKTFIKN